MKEEEAGNNFIKMINITVAYKRVFPVFKRENFVVKKKRIEENQTLILFTPSTRIGFPLKSLEE